MTSNVLLGAVQVARRILSAHWGLVLVLLVALGFRVAQLLWFHVFPAGDVFNFLMIAEGLPRLDYAPDEKRLPFYPLLTLLFHPFLDWEVAAVTVALLASLLSLVVLYALGRTLNLSRLSLALALLLFQAQPQFIVASTRGYADTTFVALVAGALLALCRSRTVRGALLTGVLLGAAATTRYEGMVVAAALLLLWLLVPRVTRAHAVPPPGIRWAWSRRLPLVALAAAALTVVPYGALSALNHRPLFGAGYLKQAQEEGYGVSNPRELWENVRKVWTGAGLIDALPILRDAVREAVEDPFGIPRNFSDRIREPYLGTSLLALAGIATFLLRREFRVLLVLAVVLIALTLPLAWWVPLERFHVFVMPITTLLATAGVSGLQSIVVHGTAGRFGPLLRRALGVVMLSLVVSLWVTSYAAQTRDRLKKHNGRDFAYYQAVHAARSLPGVIVFDDLAHGFVNVYFQNRALPSTGVPSDDRTPRGMLAALRSRGATYAVVAAGQEREFPFLSEPGVEVSATFEWPMVNEGVSRATIYQLRGATGQE